MPHTQKKKERDRLFSLWLSQLLSPPPPFLSQSLREKEKKAGRPITQDRRQGLELESIRDQKRQCRRLNVRPRAYILPLAQQISRTHSESTLCGYVCWFFSALGPALHQSHIKFHQIWKALDISIYYFGTPTVPHTRLSCYRQYTTTHSKLMYYNKGPFFDRLFRMLCDRELRYQLYTIALSDKVD